MKKIAQILCFLLVFVMVFSMISITPVSAAENNSAVSAELPAMEETIPESKTEPVISPVSIDEPTSNDAGLFSSRATYPNGKYRQKAVIWTTNGERIEYTYNGKYNNYNQLLMHTLWYDGDWRTAYCIEPGKTVFNSSDYDEVENSGVDPWGQLDYSKQRGVGLALLYGYPNGINSDDVKTQIAYQLATYLIIHEIILGWREDVHPFTRTNDAYFNVFGGGTPENPESLEITSEYYSSVHTKRLNSEDIWFAYNHISNALATHDLIPSFASYFASMAPTHTMVSNGDGTYSIVLTDTNNILSAYDFSDTEEMHFSKSEDGNTLTITTKGSDISDVTIAPTRIVPNVENSAYLIWNASTGSQELCTLKGAQDDPVPAYFKLKLPTGKLQIQKQTSNGNCLSGWQFEIYSDAACTQLVSGPHTTDTTAQILLPNMQAGTYWVKETGNASAMVNDLYYCEENIKQVTVVAGETSTVNFLNILIPRGHLAVEKTTNTATDYKGWKFALYYDEACTQLAYGPIATDSQGLVLFESIVAGEYWIKEIGHTDTALGSYYTCVSRNPQLISIRPNTTANAYFYNTLNTGSITIHKTDPDQRNLSDAHFLLEWSASGSIWTPVEYSPTPGWGKCTTPGIQNGILVTSSSGRITFQGLAVGVYYRITEVEAPNGFQLLGDYAYEGKLTHNGEVVTINVVNTPVFTLPHTGSRSMIGVSVGLILCLLTCIGAVIYLKKKES